MTFFQKEAPSGNFDVAMFAWSGSPLVSGNGNIYKTDGGQNFGKYSSLTVDADMKELLAELDKNKQFVLMKKIDTELWNDLATIPLFAFPAVLASAKNTAGLHYNATQADLSWNIQEWGLS